jgi:two-component system, OmpR family, sensor histidine kinase BaeS
MRNRLLWKLLLTNNLPVIGVIFLVVWLAVDKLAAQYFMELMKIYDVPPKEIHQMFLTSIHQYLMWASLAALAVAFVLSFLLTRRVLRPLSQMTAITKEVAAGNFSLRAEISTDDEVGELGIAFNNMADRLGKIEQLRKNMVADVAHELRTPLTNLRGYLEALNDGVLPPLPETLQMLQQENLRLVHLVENLQQLARADAARAYLQREVIILSDLVNQMVELHRLNFQKKAIGVAINCDDHEMRVSADRDKLLQAMQNLLDNCCKYTPPGGWVTITLGRVSEGIKVDFHNSGPGISPTDLPFIFERFFRADRSRSREGGGAGIGLAITKELIEAHGGLIGADSVGDNTHIWFILPD